MARNMYTIHSVTHSIPKTPKIKSASVAASFMVISGYCRCPTQTDDNEAAVWTVAFCTFGGQLPPFYLVLSSVCHSVSLSSLALSQKFKINVDVNQSEEPGHMSADIGNISLVSANNYRKLAAGLKAAFSLSLSELTKTMYNFFLFFFLNRPVV